MKVRSDRWILLCVTLLILIGLVAVYSSTSVISPDLIEKYKKRGVEISQFAFVKKQLFTVVLGLAAMFVAYKVRIEHLKKWAIPLLLISLVAVLLVFTPLGISAGGARRWLRLWPTSFQPSELVKLSMVVFMAWYLSSSYYRKDCLRSFLFPIGIIAAFSGVFLRQPDFGAVMSLALLTIAMLFLAGIRLRYLLSLSVLAVPLLILIVSKPYRLKRVTAFLDPWKDPQGSGFQLIQSFIALGSGGLTGAGPGESRQKLAFLPEVHTDFIFSLIGEELGFAGAVIVLVLFLFLFLRGVAIGRRAVDPFQTYLAYGISTMIALQALINFAVVTGMVPTKGLPLPFISYGGSSLIINMTAIGFLLNLSRAHEEAAFGREPAVEMAGQLRVNTTPPSAVASAGGTASRWKRGFSYSHCSRRMPRQQGPVGNG